MVIRSGKLVSRSTLPAPAAAQLRGAGRALPALAPQGRARAPAPASPPPSPPPRTPPPRSVSPTREQQRRPTVDADDFGDDFSPSLPSSQRVAAPLPQPRAMAANADAETVHRAVEAGQSFGRYGSTG